MKNLIKVLALGAILCAALGCQAGPTEVSKAQDAKLRTEMGAKFDINNVPPDKRDMVRAMMEANARGNSPKGAPPTHSTHPTGP